MSQRGQPIDSDASTHPPETTTTPVMARLRYADGRSQFVCSDVRLLSARLVRFEARLFSYVSTDQAERGWERTYSEIEPFDVQSASGELS